MFEIEKFALNSNIEKIKIAIEVTDNSLWNFFSRKQNL